MGRKIQAGAQPPGEGRRTNGEEDLCRKHQLQLVRIITDRDTGRSKGFGFVEMGSEDAAAAAISALNGSEVDGRQIKVNEAHDRPRREDNRW